MREAPALTPLDTATPSTSLGTQHTLLPRTQQGTVVTVSTGLGWME